MEDRQAKSPKCERVGTKRHAQPPDLHMGPFEAARYIQEREIYVLAVRLTKRGCLHWISTLISAVLTMPRQTLWDRIELRWIWIYQGLATAGAAHPIFFQLLQQRPFVDLFQPGLLTFVVNYVLLLSIEVILVHTTKPFAWGPSALQGGRFAIASAALYQSTRRVLIGTNFVDNGSFRVVATPHHDIVIFFVWWMATYHGLSHTVAVWALSRVQGAPSGTTSQFGPAIAASLWPVRLLSAIDEQRTCQSPSLPIRFASKIIRIVGTVFGSLAVFLCFARRGYLRGEPRVNTLTYLGIKRAGVAFDKDPKTADYPVVRIGDLTMTTENGHCSDRRTLSPEEVSTVGHALAPLNDHVARPTTGALSSNTDMTLDRNGSASARSLRPRFLCIIDKSQKCGYRVVSRAEDSSIDSAQYVFLSYTRLQFCTNISGDPGSAVGTRDSTQSLAAVDAAILTSIAINASTRVGVRAFWIDFECLRPESPEDSDASWNIGDVYQINDIVRGSYCMAIACGPSLDNDLKRTNCDFSMPALREWLHVYGSRLWTLPEALLCPSNHGILIYSFTGSGFEVERIEKRNLAERIWFDAESTRNLLEHYEGSLNLSQIDFISLALQSLQRRKTVTRMPADFIYALMGLLRERVPVREQQSTFEAFALLSLANDSQKLLERLFCMRPETDSEEWHNMSDFWGANIRDIVPGCEITEVSGGDAVTIDRMNASTIYWASLPAVEFEMKAPTKWRLLWSWQRTDIGCILPLIAFAWVLALLHLAILNFAFDKRSERSKAQAAFLFSLQLSIFTIPAAVALLTTGLFLASSLNRIYGGEIKYVQARFLGFNGVADLGLVERTLFGRNCGRIIWSALNPKEHDAADQQHRSTSSFTLVDTSLMTATTFQAATRPSIVAVPGKHRGTVRAMLCSHDAGKNVYHRERVLRMDEKILRRMSTMGSARFSLMPAPVYRDD